MAESIANLRIYGQARSLEDQVYELVKNLPEEQSYPLGNDLRRASAGVSHFISEAHERYSYQVKIEALHSARLQAEQTNRLLEQFQGEGYGQTVPLIEEYIGVIKQSWGLIKYLKNKQAERQAAEQTKPKDKTATAKTK